MPSWRDAASAQAQEDLDGLVALVLPVAQEQLAKHGEFYPFAASISDQGRPGLIATRASAGGEHPRSAAVVEECIAALRTKRGEIRAAAIVTDARLPQTGTDAVAVELEHVEGHAITVLLPYRKRQFGRTIEYGHLRAEPGRRRIWPI